MPDSTVQHDIAVFADFLEEVELRFPDIGLVLALIPDNVGLVDRLVTAKGWSRTILEQPRRLPIFYCIESDRLLDISFNPVRFLAKGDTKWRS
jgi:hypothetical protein